MLNILTLIFMILFFSGAIAVNAWLKNKEYNTFESQNEDYLFFNTYIDEQINK